MLNYLQQIVKIIYSSFGNFELESGAKRQFWIPFFNSFLVTLLQIRSGHQLEFFETILGDSHDLNILMPQDLIRQRLDLWFDLAKTDF